MPKQKKLEPLVPPDMKRCQTMKPNGHTFMSLGGVPGHIQCDNKPDYIATERKPDKDGRKGSMSMCAKCAVVFQEQKGTKYADLVSIEEVANELG